MRRIVGLVVLAVVSVGCSFPRQSPSERRAQFEEPHIEVCPPYCDRDHR
jgi:hypothetical protein